MITKPILYKDDRNLWHLRGPRDRTYPRYWSPKIHSYGATPCEVWIRFLRFEDARQFIAGDYALDEGKGKDREAL